MYVLASGDAECVDVFRLADLKETGFTSKSGFVGFGLG